MFGVWCSGFGVWRWCVGVLMFDVRCLVVFLFGVWCLAFWCVLLVVCGVLFVACVFFTFADRCVLCVVCCLRMVVR